MIVEETNAIGTAYLRLDLLPTAAQPALRERFRQYVEARLEAYRRLPDIAAAHAEETRATQLQGDIWRQAVAACQEAGVQPATMLLLPALNAMSNITTTRTLGDLEMLQWTTAGRGARLALLVHHTNAEREWACDRHSFIGRLDKALDEAQARDWTVVSMKDDWKRIFPFGAK